MHANAATAQDPAQADAAASDGEIVVTGFRASLQDALNQKRRSDQIIDAITAEDIAKFPDANLAEAIQRLPGVSIDRDNGEGRTITVRGLGGDFQLVRLNGADAQSVAGGNQSDAGANRSRGFDFNTFASELFGGVTITKTTAAVNDEGSLGAIIDLTTGRPLSYAHNRFALGAEGEYRENGKTWNPRLTGLASVKLADNFGILVSGAYQKQKQQIDSYRRSIGAFDYTYRNSQLNGVTPNTYGFARPGGTGVTFGSDPAAYALVTPDDAHPRAAVDQSPVPRLQAPRRHPRRCNGSRARIPRSWSTWSIRNTTRTASSTASPRSGSTATAPTPAPRRPAPTACARSARRTATPTASRSIRTASPARRSIATGR